MTSLKYSLVAVVLVAASHRSIAQQTQGQVALGAGIATDTRGNTSNAVTLAPSVSATPDPRLSLGIGASAPRFQNQAWSLAGSAGMGARAPLGSMAALTLNASGAL